MNKISLYVSAILLGIIAGCSREGPVQEIIGQPSAPQALVPISELYLGNMIHEPSGIAYNAVNNSLMIVGDSQPEIFEIDFKGYLKRTITTTSGDMEGIAVTPNADTLYVVEETKRLVTWYLPNGKRGTSFTVDVSTQPNNALEGITIDGNGHLQLLNEKLPGMLLEYDRSLEVRRTTLSIAADYSDIFYEAQSNSLWIISDESKKIMQTTLRGELIKEWTVPFTKGEGITIVRDTMYVVNDADAKLYIFNKPK